MGKLVLPILLMVILAVGLVTSVNLSQKDQDVRSSAAELEGAFVEGSESLGISGADIPKAELMYKDSENLVLNEAKGFSGVVGQAGALGPSAGFTVTPILFVPSDRKEGAAASRKIADTFELLRRWYSGSLEKDGHGFTFGVRKVEVYHSTHTLLAILSVSAMPNPVIITTGFGIMSSPS